MPQKGQHCMILCGDVRKRTRVLMGDGHAGLRVPGVLLMTIASWLILANSLYAQETVIEETMLSVESASTTQTVLVSDNKESTGKENTRKNATAVMASTGTTNRRDEKESGRTVTGGQAARSVQSGRPGDMLVAQAANDTPRTTPAGAATAADIAAEAQARTLAVSELRQDIGVARTGIAEVKGDIAGVKGDLLSLKGDLGELRGQHAEVKAFVDQLKRSTETTGTLRRDLEKERAERIAKDDELSRNFVSLKGDLATLRTDVTVAKGDVATLREDMNVMNKDMAAVKTTTAAVDALRREVAAIKVEHATRSSESTQSLAALRGEVVSLKKDVTGLQSGVLELARSSVVIDSLRRDLADERSQRTTKDSEITQALAGVRTDSQALKGDISVLRNDVSAVQSALGEVRRSTAAIAELAAGQASLKADVGGVRSDVTALKGDVTSLKGDLGAVKADAAAAKADAAGLKTDVASVKADVTGAKADLTALKTDAGTLKIDVAALKSDGKDLQQRVTALQRSTGAIAELAAMKTDVGTMKIDVAALKSESRDVQNALRNLARSTAVIESLQKDLSKEEAARIAKDEELGKTLLTLRGDMGVVQKELLSMKSAGGQDVGGANLNITGNALIGAKAADMKLTLDTDGGILAKGIVFSGAKLTTSGEGTRFLWYPRKASLRAGWVSGNQWDEGNIGNYSVAFGRNNTAAGVGAVVSGGDSNTASDEATVVAGGGKNAATAFSATVSGGNSNTSSGHCSAIAGGYTNTASGKYAFIAGGSNNDTAADYSMVGGRNMKLAASAKNSFLWGYSSTPVEVKTADSFVVMSKRFSFGSPDPKGRLTFADLDGGSAGNYLRYDPKTGSVYYDASSRRYKDNIQDLRGDFSSILRVRPKSYVDRATGMPEIGYIAEEFEELGLGMLVTYDAAGRPDGLKYEKVPLYVLEVVKKQQAAIESLSEQNRELERRLRALEDRVR